MLKASLVAATLAAGMSAASAMPIGKLGSVDPGVQPEQVRTVCNAYGRCWWVPGPRYGYYRGYRPYYRPYRSYGYYRPYRYGAYGYRRYW